MGSLSFILIFIFTSLAPISVYNLCIGIDEALLLWLAYNSSGVYRMVLLNNPCRVSTNKSENFCPQDLSIGQSITSTLFMRNANIALEAIDEMRFDKPELDSTMRNLVIGANESYFEARGCLDPGEVDEDGDGEGDEDDEDDEDAVGALDEDDGEGTIEENDRETDGDVEDDQISRKLSVPFLLSTSSLLPPIVLALFSLSTELESSLNALTNSSYMPVPTPTGEHSEK